ncbi:MAG: TIGR03960 family B12-binding radical SAM protein [Deltaproteobacteria bacterium]|nr:TIGR03960 family B12-binding radical SAM protein [Deltaproteobacteria bacterium]
MADHSFLSRIQRPTRYLGREVNAVHKDPRAVNLRVALLFPDLYEVGMSHLGLGLLYDILNQAEDVWAERAYAPAPDLEAYLRLRRRHLASLESGTPLRDFDLLGASLQYELCYTNLLNMLDLGGVPLLASGRGPGDPVVIGGGPAAFNPEPVAPFFDAILLGDGEEAVTEMAAVVKEWKAARGTRQELWQALEGVDGVYVPAFFEVAYDKEGRVREIMPRGRREVVRKRILADLNLFPASPRPLVPYCQTVHDRLNVEIGRGCTRGCRYCQAGIIYRPVRERAPEVVGNWVETTLPATGYEEVSLLSLSPGDYQALPWLLNRLMDQMSPQGVALSLPSLRADTLTPDIMAQIRRVRRTGLTIAPEAGSDRLRKVINKNLPEEEILAAAHRAFAGGWQLLKLYFMLGLPGETPEDREAIAHLAQRILQSGGKKRRVRLNISLSTFIPKPHTPFQWEGQAGLEESRRRLHEVKDRLNQPGIQVKWNAVAQSWLEGVFSRGDRRLAAVLLAAHRRGCRLDAWSEHLRLEPWLQAFQEARVDPEFYLRARELEEVLPWSHLDAGVSRDFLLEERRRAYQGISTPDCRTAGCQNCGVCDHEQISLRLAEAIEPAVFRTPSPEACNAPPAVWYRLTFAKLDEAKWLSHLELITAFYRSLRRSGLPLALSSGFHPLPRLALHGALPVGVESLAEMLDLALTAPLGESTIAEQLNGVLPPGLKILEVQRLFGKRRPPRVEAAKYRVTSPEPVFSRAAADRFLAQAEVWVTRHRPRQAKTVEMRRLVAALAAATPREVHLTLNIMENDNLKITEILEAIFGLTDEQTGSLEILKLGSIQPQNPEAGGLGPRPAGKIQASR